jgi:hypothetical protein
MAGAWDEAPFFGREGGWEGFQLTSWNRQQSLSRAGQRQKGDDVADARE